MPQRLTQSPIPRDCCNGSLSSAPIYGRKIPLALSLARLAQERPGPQSPSIRCTKDPRLAPARSFGAGTSWSPVALSSVRLLQSGPSPASLPLARLAQESPGPQSPSRAPHELYDVSSGKARATTTPTDLGRPDHDQPMREDPQKPGETGRRSRSRSAQSRRGPGNARRRNKDIKR